MSKPLLLIALSAPLFWSCSSSPKLIENSDFNYSSDSSVSNLSSQSQGRPVPDRLDEVVYPTSCNEPPINSTEQQGIDSITYRSLANSSYLQTALSKMGVDLNAVDLNMSKQFTSQTVIRCSDNNMVNINYVSRVLLKIPLSNFAMLHVSVDLDRPENYNYEKWLVKGIQKQRLLATGTFNNIDNGTRVSDIKSIQHVVTSDSLIISGADISKNITSSDQSLQSNSVNHYTFVFDVNENITSYSHTRSLDTINILSNKTRGRITAQSVGGLGITVSPVDSTEILPVDPVCNTNPTLTLGQASLQSQAITVCPTEDNITPLPDREPEYEYAAANSNCSTQKKAFDRADAEARSARWGILGSGVGGGASVGAIILGGPPGWFLGGFGLAAVAFGVGSVAPTYEYKEEDLQTARQAYEACNKQYRVRRT